MLADASTGEIAGWVAGTVAVLGVLGTGTKALLDWIAGRRDKATANAGQQRKEERDELREVVAMQRQDLTEHRALIHDLRGDLNAAKLDLAVCRHDLEECKQDRADLHAMYEDMAGAMRDKGMPVPFRPAAPRGAAPRQPEGGK